jgi:hypothetical protein
MSSLGIDLTAYTETVSVCVFDDPDHPYQVAMAYVVLCIDVPNAATECLLVDHVAQLTGKPQKRGVRLVLFGATRCQ